MLVKILCCFIIPIVLISSVSLAAPADEKETDPLVLKKLEEFQDWKFGFFMHWGIYSQWGCMESWPLVEVDKWARPHDLPPWVERNRDFKRFFNV